MPSVEIPKLERSLRDLESILSSTDDFVYVFDRNQTYTYANRAFLDRFSTVKQSDVIGKRFSEVCYPPTLAKTYGAQIEELLVSGEPLRVEETLADTTLGTRSFEHNFIPIFDELGKVEAVAGITRDVTEIKEISRTLQQAETMHQTLFEYVDQGVGLIEVLGAEDDVVDFRWLAVNQAFESQTGISDPTGKRGRELNPTPDQAFFEIFRNVVHGRKPLHFENYAESLQRWFDIQAIPVGNQDCRKVVVLFRDITAQKQADRNAALSNELHNDFARLSDSEKIMQVAAAKLGRHLQASQVIFSKAHEETHRLEVIHSWSAGGDNNNDTITNPLRISEIINDSFLSELEAVRAIAVNDITSDSLTASRADEYRHRDIAAMLQIPYLRDGDLKFEVLIYHTEPHRWREDENDLLCELTGRLWWRLQRAWAEEALYEISHRKDRFLAVLSHELRNPLAPIELSLPLLDKASPDSREGRLARQVIKRQVKQLTRLVDDLLDVNRIESDKIHLKLERLELNELAEHTVEDHRALFQAQGIELTLTPSREPIYVEADRNRLAQIVGNLLHNAVKFTGAGEEAIVSVSSDCESNQALLRVKDTGMGMEPATITQLFDPFVQADSSLEHTVGGLGLGLALVQGLVELHSGEVSASSDGLGTGSEFVVRLPLASEESSKRSPIHDISRAADRITRKILIIEDNPDIAEVLRTVLTLEGHQVEVAHSGAEGLDKARSYQPQVVICDIGLPELNGYEVAQKMRSDPELQSSHLIALSGYAGPDDIARSYRAGFDHHLAKPPRLSKLKALLAAGADQPPPHTPKAGII